MTDKGVRRTLKKLHRSSNLHNFTVLHDHDLIGKGQSLGLVVSHVDHRRLDPLMQLLQLGTQLPFQMRVDHGQRFIKHDDINVFPYQTATHGNLLLVVRRKVCRPCPKHLGNFQHLRYTGHPALDDVFVPTSVAQWKGQIVVDRHRVVNDWKLEHLGNVALCRRQGRDVLIVEQHLAVGWDQEARNDIEKRGLAAAGRTKQCISATIFPGKVDFLQRIIVITRRVRIVAVSQVGEFDLCHEFLSSSRQIAVRRKEEAMARIQIERVDLADEIGMHAR